MGFVANMWIKGDNYLTVLEYCKRMGYSDKRPVYRRLKRGDIDGAVMIGKVWLIPAHTILTDNRITTGLYINWRRKRNV